MDVKFVNPGFHYMLDSIMEFQKDDSTYFWNDSLFYFFKDLDKEYAYSLSTEKRREYFEEKLLEIYQENELLLTFFHNDNRWYANNRYNSINVQVYGDIRFYERELLLLCKA